MSRYIGKSGLASRYIGPLGPPRYVGVVDRARWDGVKSAYALVYNASSVVWNGGDFDANNITANGTLILAGSVAFTPASLFANGEVGAWYDFNDISTLWKDDAGTIAVTTSGDVVARVDDKSGNGKHLIQSTVAARPVYTSDANGSRLVFDGVDDFMPLDGTMVVGTNYSVHFAWRHAATPVSAASWVVGGTLTGTGNANLHVGWQDSTAINYGQWFNTITHSATWSQTPNIASAMLRTDGRFLRVDGVERAMTTDISHLVGWNGAAVARRTTSHSAVEVYSLILRAGDTGNGTARGVEDYQANIAGVTI